VGFPRRPGSAPIALAGALAAALAAGLVALLLVAPPGGHSAGGRGASGEAAPAGRALASQAPESPAAAEVGRLLQRRAVALLGRDRLGFLTTVDPGSPVFRRSQAALFDALAAVPLRTWSYQLDPYGQRTVPASRRARYAAPTYLPSVVRLSYALAGFDAVPTVLPMYLTFVRRPAGWLLASDSDLDATGVRTVRELWDFGPVAVATGRRSLVLGHPHARKALTALALETDRAVPAVTAVWGAGWAQRVVLLVPASSTELSRLLNGARDVSGLAAVATAWTTGTSAPLGQRVLVNPPNFERLGRLGRRVVLTHEIAHLAARGATGAATPTWLVEGFADYVAYRAAAVPVGDAARELAADVRAGRIPPGLPAATRFGGVTGRVAQAYEEAWLACRMIAESGGPAAVVRFYRATGGRGDPATVLAGAFRDVLGTTEAAFTARWRGYLGAQLS